MLLKFLINFFNCCKYLYLILQGALIIRKFQVLRYYNILLSAPYVIHYTTLTAVCQ